MSGTLWAILSGVCTGVGGLSYRYAAEGRVPTIQLNAGLGICGCLLFAMLGGDQWAEFSPVACLLGLAGGVSQYAAIRLLRWTMRRGPLAPAWCAMSLGGFVPVIVCAFLFMGERPSRLQWLALLFTCAAVGAAAGQGKVNAGTGGITRRGMAVYGAMLVLLMVLAGGVNVILKYAAAGPLLQAQGKILMCFVYVGMAAACGADLTLRRGWVVNRHALIGGGVCAAAALGSYLIILSIMDLPSIRIFALNSTASILTVALGTAVRFREKPDLGWYMVVVFSIAAVILNR